jgi:hydrophobic/amphiphilic exporter-1 (mainly G- bacteria), HAE1 family
MSRKLFFRTSLAVAMLAASLGVQPAATAQSTPVPPSAAQPVGGPMSQVHAVRVAMAQSPTLSAAMLEAQQAVANVEAEEGLYVPILQLDAGATHIESPTLEATGGTRVSESNVYAVGSEIRHTFPWGTFLSFRLEGNRTDNARLATTIDPTTGSPVFFELGPGYGILGRFSVVQPLLRGFGTDVGRASLRQAELGRAAAEFSEDQAASETLRDVLVAYWELWYADRAIEIEIAARNLAVEQRDEALQRIEAGALAPVEVLTFESRIAELSQSLAVAEAQRQNQALAFGQLLGYEARQSLALQTAADTVPSPPTPTLERVLAEARDESFELKRLDAQLSIARDQASIAGEAERPRLDLDAYAQAEGLGNDDVPAALEQFSTFGAFSAHVGLTFELPLSGTRRSAQVRSAALEVQQIQEQIRAARLQIGRAAAAEVVAAEQARQRVDLARQSVEISEKNVEAQRIRYEQGEAIAIEVLQAEDSLRRARLSVERAKVDLIEASIRLDHLMGELLRRYAGDLPRPQSGALMPIRPRTAVQRTSYVTRPLF